MKTFRLFLVGVLFLVVTATTPAQAAGQFIGYMPLFTRVDPNLSIQAQSQKAFRRIMPKMMALQKSGAILQFEPELRIGVLKVTYSAASELSVLSGTKVYTNVRDAMVAAPQLLASSVAATGPSFLAELYSSCFQAVSLPVSSHIVGSLRDKTGRVLASYEDDADGSGGLYGCFSSNGSFSDVVPGYKLTFKVYDDSALTTLLGTYSVSAPSIQFTTVDNPHAIVGGTGPAGKPYDVEWLHPNLNAANSETDRVLHGTISSAGKWAKDFGPWKFRGGDEFDIFVQQNAQFTFVYSQNAPAIYCQLGSNYCDVAGFAFQPATLSITHGSATYTFSGKFSSCGCFTQFLEKNGTPIYLKAGDKISGTSVAAYTLPNLTAGANFYTDVVMGRAPANKYFELWVNDPYLDPCSCGWYFIWAHSNSSGIYSGDFSSQVDLVSTYAANLEVLYQEPASGNITDYYRSIGP